MWAMRGLTAAEITHQTKLPRSTVKYHLKRFKETGSWARREYPVRVKTLTPFSDCIRKHLKLHPHASATELHELLATKFQLMVSVRTVQRYLKTAIREQKARDENSEEDSDTSVTEEISVASGNDTPSPKVRTRERVRSAPHTAYSSRTEATTPPVVARDEPPHSPALPLHASAALSASSQTPALPQVPCNLLTPYPVLLPAWQESQATSSAPPFPAFPLGSVPPSLPSIPLGFYPMYHQFSPALTGDATTFPYPATQFPAVPPLPQTPQQRPTPPAPSAKLDPSLEALVNAALVSE